MAKVKTVKIKKGDGFTVINHEDFDENIHELLVGEDEMIVEPRGVRDAKPFVIGVKDFDELAYEKVSQTNSVSAEIAKQSDRKTLTEKVAEAQDADAAAKLQKEADSKAEAEKADKTPQKTLKENQGK